jgi:hypothetical protein
MTWTTTAVTPTRKADEVFALTDDPAITYSSRAMLLQRNETGETRVVLGFAAGVAILPADELPAWNGRTLDRIGLEVRDYIRLNREDN